MKIRFLHIVTAWIFFSLLMTFIMLIFHPPQFVNYNIVKAFRWEISFALVWIPATRFVLFLASKFPVHRNTAVKHIAVLFITGILLSILLCIIHGLLIYILTLPINEFTSTVIMNSLFYNMDKMFLVYFALLVLQHASGFYEQYREKEVKASKLETELAKAQMEALKMQLHPHFLFNTLNAIVTLIHKDPDIAEQMIVRLSDFLRLTLKNPGKQMISLQEELEFVKRYLEIEQVRFYDRLSVNIKMEKDTCNAAVPYLILQPLIENAIKHGFTPNTAKGVLTISASKIDGKLNIHVFDNGSHDSFKKANEITVGVGLSNTRERLERLFDKDASLTFQPCKPQGFEVIVSLPFRMSDQ